MRWKPSRGRAQFQVGQLPPHGLLASLTLTLLALSSVGCGNISSPRRGQDARGGILIIDGGATPDHLAADLVPLQPDKGVATDGWVPPPDTQPLQASTVVLAITGMT